MAYLKIILVYKKPVYRVQAPEYSLSRLLTWNAAIVTASQSAWWLSCPDSCG